MAFLKLDCGILDSTLWVDREARDVFLTALLMARPYRLEAATMQIDVLSGAETGWEVPSGHYGLVEAAGPGIVRRACVQQDDGMQALVRLGNPEAESRTSAHEGRRLVRISGGYIALNFDKYRGKDHTSTERSRRHREKKRATGATRPATGATRKRAKGTQAEAEAEAERDTPLPPTPRPADRPPPRDPMRASLEPTRPEVVAIWNSWKLLAEKPNAELTRRDGRYELIVDRLDRYGEEAVRDALLGAKHDDWCQGRADGVKHLRLTYILGENKPEKFEELQAAGERIRTKLSRQRVAHDHERELDRRERRDRKQVDPVKTQQLIDKAIEALERGRKG